MAEYGNNRESILNDSIPKLLWKFSYANFISHFLFQINGLIDAIFISRGVGISALAGVGIALSLAFIAMTVAWSIGSGSASIIARAMGENQTQKASQAVSNSIFIILLFSALILVLAVFYPQTTLRLLGANEEILPYAQGYFVTYAWGMIFHLLSLYGSSILGAYGFPKHLMYANAIGIPINILLNYLFIFQFQWGTAGSALATNIASFFTLSYMIVFFYRTKLLSFFCWEKIKPQFSICREIIAIGFPLFFFDLSNLTIGIYINRYLSLHGAIVYIAIINIFFRIFTVAAIPYYAICQGLCPIVGFNFGNKKYHRVTQTVQTALMASLILAAITMLIILVWPGPMLRLFSKDESLILTASSLLRIIFSTWPFIAFTMTGMGLLSALGNFKAAIRFSIIQQVIISMSSIVILPYFFGIKGIFYHTALVNALGGLLGGTFILFQLKAIKKMSVTL